MLPLMKQNGPPSCTGGTNVCRIAKFSLVTESCNMGNSNYHHIPNRRHAEEVSLTQESCNTLGLEEDYTYGNPKYTCWSIVANSIIDRKLDVCSDECSSAYIAEGRGHPEDTLIHEDMVLKNNICSQVPVDCVNGYEVGTGLTCTEACDGQYCAAGSSTISRCSSFTGHIHRDGSCTGFAACVDTTIEEVKGPSCIGWDLAIDYAYSYYSLYVQTNVV